MMGDEFSDFLHASPSREANDPIRLTMQALVKAIRTQSVSIKELDQRITDGAFSKSDAERWNLEMQSRYAEKDDIIELANRMTLKSDDTYTSSIDSKLTQTIDQLERLGDMLRVQALSIRDINARIDFVGKEIDTLKVPNFDPVFAYIDRQNSHIAADIERKLAIKADKKDVEIFVPQRIEDLYRSLNGTVLDLKSDVARKATKEEFETLARNKADVEDLRAVAQDVTEKTTIRELQDLMDGQIKPLQSGLSSVEKTVANQEKYYKTVSDQNILLMEKITNATAPPPPPQIDIATDPTVAKKIRSIVEDILLEKRVGEVTEVSVQTLVQEHTNKIIREMSSLINTSKLESITSTHDSIVQSLQPISNRIDSVQSIANESKIKLTHMKSSMKDFSENVAKALGRKADVVDIKKALKEVTIDQENIKRQIANVKYGAEKGNLQTGSNSPIRVGVGGGEGGVINASISSRTSINNSIMKTLNEERLSETISRWKTDSIFASNSLESDNYLRPSNSTSTRLFVGSPEEEDSIYNYGDNYSSNSSGGEENEGGSRSSSKMGAFATSKNVSSVRSKQNSTKSDTATVAGGSNLSTSSVNHSYTVLKRDFTVVLQNLDAIQKDFKSLKSKYELDIAALRENLSDKVSSAELKTATLALKNNISPAVSTVFDGGFYNSEWKVALGELSMNLRRELSDKCGREEMLSSVRQETSALEVKTSRILRDLDERASQDAVRKVENELTSLRSKVAGELTGARWLWTSATLGRDGWIPWDHQVTNAAPAVLLWKKGSTVIKVRMPGLYRLTFAVFTTLSVSVQVCVNGEAVISLQPDTGDSSLQAAPKSGVVGGNPVSLSLSNEHKYILRHMKHSVGEVTCVSIDECLSLPMDGAISVRYHSSQMAQGFLSLRKL